ncbi:MAG: hypothetical protein Kow00108_00360 [Calditrichia bacterium]
MSFSEKVTEKSVKFSQFPWIPLVPINYYQKILLQNDGITVGKIHINDHLIHKSKNPYEIIAFKPESILSEKGCTLYVNEMTFNKILVNYKFLLRPDHLNVLDIDAKLGLAFFIKLRILYYIIMNSLTIFILYPNHKNPAFLIPIKKSDFFSINKWFYLFKFFLVYKHVAILNLKNKPENLYNALLKKVKMSSFERIYIGSGDTLVFLGKNKVVRVAFSGRGFKRLINNYQLLNLLNNFHFSFYVPRAIKLGNTKFPAYSVEQRLKGSEIELHMLNTENQVFYTNLASTLIAELHKKSNSVKQMDYMNFENLIQKYINQLKDFQDFESIPILMQTEHYLKQTCLNRNVNFVITHGDFKLSNILKNEDKFVLFDWDLGEKQGLPFMDLILFISYLRTVLYQEQISMAILNVYLNYTSHYSDIFEKYTIESGLTKLYPMKVYFILTLIHFHFKQSDYYLKKDIDWMRKNIIDPISKMLNGN